MRILLFLFIFFFTSSLAFSGGNQPYEKSNVQQVQQARPNLPGDFLIQLGVSLFDGAPDTMSLATLRSRAVNIYYLFRIPFGEQSNFSFHPGFGLGLENYMFKDNNVTLQMNGDQTEVVGIGFENLESVKKSKFNTNYIDIPVEIRFSTNTENPDKGFKLAVGGRIGLLFDAKTKIKYEVDDDTKLLQMKEDYSLNKFRYGVYGRIGLGNFSVFYYQNLSKLFKDGKGPAGTEDLKTVMTGISFALF